MAVNGTQTRETLANDLWRACDILRRDNNCGGVMEYIEHLAWLLFLRFLDAQEDTWETEASLSGKKYERVLDGDLRWANWAHKDWPADDLIQFVHTRLIPALQGLGGDPFRETVAAIFSERNVIVAASGYNLKDVLQIVNQIDFLSEDDVHTVSVVYESLLQRLGNENKMAGEFYTPRAVIRFVVRLVAPKLNETVYDPATGSGGFLAEAFEYLKSKNKDLTIEQNEKVQTETFFGREKKAVPYLLGMMNVVLHGVSRPNIRRGNTLEEPMKSAPAERFDVILTNPPFGGTENQQIQENFAVQVNATELLFLQHIMKKLKPRAGARCGMVMPEGVLFRGGAFATVKKDLLEQFNLHTIVSLPPGAFAPYADVKTVLMFFERPGPTRATWYYELPLPAGLKKFSKGNPIEDGHLSEADSLWKAWRAGQAGIFEQLPELNEDWQDWNRAQLVAGGLSMLGQNSWIVPVEEIARRGYDLSVRNPHQTGTEDLPRPIELTSRLLERVRELHDIIAGLHEKLGNGDE
ncbi:MAG: SAM-dependent DNA methyltransferase [Anaerolineales bacterium]|nr:SAM-dependent DNA methyltransferase [Anaerolineales bacterium]